ncbi:MAG TPA: Do family serine endopeptidase [Acidobacteriaceae bacterium]|jgi:serine protease Do|nr:Do family serine endopeptidase [Acidobacteriaceae bacterium]
MNLREVKSIITRRLAVAALASAAIVGAGAWTLARPASAAAPAAAPLDDSSVGPLISLDQAMETLAARVTPAVVNVTVTAKVKQPHGMMFGNGQGDDQDQGDDQGQDNQQQMQQFFGQNSPFGQFFHGPMQQQQPTFEHGLGSGVIISPDGYIVTNNHVIDGATDINVTMSNREVYAAKLIGADPLTDLAVIKIEGHGFPSIPWGDSTKLEPGQTVLAFGNPYGFQFSVTRGIISALNRPNLEADRRKPGQFIQTDAAINQGNSGGALVNARGELIGINAMLYSPTGAFAGMGFAIPTQIAQPTVATLMRDGKVNHGYIGISIEDVTPQNAKFFDMKKAIGAIVSDVTADSPGGKAGLKNGDVVTAFNGKPVSDAGELQMETSQKQPGDTIHLSVIRDGKTIEVPVTLESGKGTHEPVVAQNSNGKGRWGVGLAELTPDVRQQIEAPESVHGALIQNVRPGSPADNAGLSRGDIIISVNRKPTTSASDVAQQLSSVPAGQDVLVLVWSNGGSTFRVLHPSEG